MASGQSKATLEFFGATTFRLRANGVTIFHDTWLDKPSLMKRHLELDDVTEADYIFISHAHFDHLPGADRLSIRTGAIVIGNCEAIRLLRDAGVPETQLLPVAGGERIPLFTRAIREQASNGTCLLAPGRPGAPPLPHSDLAALAVHVWPSLHGLLPDLAEPPAVFDSGHVFTGSASAFDCSVDITRNMAHGLFRLDELVPAEARDKQMGSFIDFISNRKRNIMSACDGGQLMFNVLVNDRAVLFNSHLGAYDGIMKVVEPRPDVTVLGIAGRGNLNGRPFDGSGAQFAVAQLKWLGEPGRVIWALHDESLIPPFRVDKECATQLVEKETRSKVVDLPYAELYDLF
ncbi:hypothetical protein B0J13DRAFT_608135 [Dactylonectria estremocensis]|uniref:Metallo-beta-lactamase domain-containing protein n=1 Tax=Dactylonectria estremocensis TaxID=1079267 RepID=A0A9P9J0C0_9HYPO|nr:hypothetical protein B0J13DRAFT_608135 [Dactylonectria estremocensis]